MGDQEMVADKTAEQKAEDYVNEENDLGWNVNIYDSEIENAKQGYLAGHAEGRRGALEKIDEAEEDEFGPVNLNNEQPDRLKPKQSGLEKLYDHCVDNMKNWRTRRWQREHDRLTMEEVDRRIAAVKEECWAAENHIETRNMQQHERIEAWGNKVESRIIKRVAEAARSSYVQSYVPLGMDTVIGPRLEQPTKTEFSAKLFADKLEGKE